MAPEGTDIGLAVDCKTGTYMIHRRVRAYLSRPEHHSVFHELVRRYVNGSKSKTSISTLKIHSSYIQSEDASQRTIPSTCSHAIQLHSTGRICPFPFWMLQDFQSKKSEIRRPTSVFISIEHGGHIQLHLTPASSSLVVGVGSPLVCRQCFGRSPRRSACGAEQRVSSSWSSH